MDAFNEQFTIVFQVFLDNYKTLKKYLNQCEKNNFARFSTADIVGFSIYQERREIIHNHLNSSRFHRNFHCAIRDHLKNLNYYYLANI